MQKKRMLSRLLTMLLVLGLVLGQAEFALAFQNLTGSSISAENTENITVDGVEYAESFTLPLTPKDVGGIQQTYRRSSTVHRWLYANPWWVPGKDHSYDDSYTTGLSTGVLNKASHLVLELSAAATIQVGFRYGLPDDPWWSNTAFIPVQVGAERTVAIALSILPNIDDAIKNGFFIDITRPAGTEITRAYLSNGPPPPLTIHAVPSSLKDVYKDIFQVGTIVTAEDLENLLTNQHINQHYDFTQTQPIPHNDSTIELKSNAPIAEIAAQIDASIYDLRIYVTVTGTQAEQAHYYSELMPMLIAKSYKIKSVVFSSVHELFDTKLFVPREAYIQVLRAALSGDLRELGVVINQVYGSGSSNATGSGSISHSFIELYNQSDVPVSLSGWSLQWQNGRMDNSTPHALSEWTKLDLESVIGARSSFLVLINDARPESGLGNIRYQIPNADLDLSGTRGQTQPYVLSNRAYSVALVKNQNLLSKNITAEEKANLVDLVGATNTDANDVAENFMGSPFEPISQQAAARRINFVNTNRNTYDFERIDYRTTGINDTTLAQMRPRWGGEGEWGRNIVIPVYIPEDVPPAQRLTFSRDAGIFDTEFNLSLGTGYEKGTIWYTLDGSDPVPFALNAYRYTVPISVRDRTDEPNGISMIGDESFLFGDPTRNEEWGGLGYYVAPKFNILKGNVVKAQVFFADGTALTDSVTKSYIIENSTVTSFDGLPVISVSTDADGLFNYDTGIFTNGDERGAEWERSAHMEFFEPVPAGTSQWDLAFAQNLGMRVHGGWSRMNPQKSMRFYASANRDQDHPTVDFDIFGGNAKTFNGEPITEFRRFILRNFGSDNGEGHMRDRFSQRLMQGTNVVGQDARPAVVFLNGEFWGAYEIRERIDEHFLNSKYNLGSTNIAQWTWEDELRDDYPADYVLLQEMKTWFQNTANHLSDPLHYAKAQTFLDIDSLIDYFIIQTFVDNRDWPQNNYNMWRYQTSDYPAENTALYPKDGRWRYIMRDLDFGLAIFENASVNRNRINTLLNSVNDDYFPDDGHWHALFFRRLCENPEFLERFINRYFDLLNTHLKPSFTNEMMDTHVAEIEAVVKHQRARWGGDSTDWFNEDSWRREVSKMRTYLNNRPDLMIGYIRDETKFCDVLPHLLATAQVRMLTLQTDDQQGHLQINGIDILPGTPGVTDAGYWSGSYLTGFTQTITAVPKEGYELAYWEIVDEPDYSATSFNSLEIDFSENTTVTAVFAPEGSGSKRDMIAAFRHPVGTSGTTIPATEGTLKDNASFEFFYADGMQANLGHATRSPVNVPNSSISPWLPVDESIDANNSAGWVFTLDTTNFEDITFDAEQGSSNHGPRDFRLAYRIGTTGDFIEICEPDTHTPILSAADITGKTFNLVSLPKAMENKPVVQLKVYISSSEARSGRESGMDAIGNGNTSINNIVFVGEPMGEQLSDIEAFITRIYQNVLNREPDDEGMAFWKNGLENGTESAASIIDYFFFGEEFIDKGVSNELFMEIAYLTFMDRPAEGEGLQFWLETLADGYSRRYVVEQMILSEEFAAIIAAYGIVLGPVDGAAGYVARMYRNVFARNYDQGGLEYWLDGFADGTQTGASIAYYFFFSDEFSNRDVSNTTFVEIAYNTLMNRDPEEEGRQFWIGELERGASRGHVLKDMIAGEEFIRICDNYGIEVGEFPWKEAADEISLEFDLLEEDEINARETDDEEEAEDVEEAEETEEAIETETDNTESTVGV